jgi:hypothetical protein
MAKRPMRCLRSLLRRTAGQRQPFRIAEALADKHLARLGPDGTKPHAFQADGLIAFVGDLAAHPAPGVGDGEEAFAFGIDRETRPAAEMARRRRQHETAEPFELPEVRLARLDAVEGRDGTRFDRNGLRNFAAFGLLLGARGIATKRDEAGYERRNKLQGLPLSASVQPPAQPVPRTGRVLAPFLE